ncbi:MAG: pilus assembly protein TadG-related protein [Pirellulaceae bacterium]
MKNRVDHIRRGPRHGSALTLCVILMFVLFSFLAFSIDTGYLSQARAELRRSADAAAMAGCWELYDQLESGNAPEGSHLPVRQVAASLALANSVCNESPGLDTTADSQDVEIGYLADMRSTNISQDASNPFFAVRVSLSKNENQNGSVPFFFGRIFGRNSIDMQSDATAVLARQIDGFRTPPIGAAGLNVLPFALDVDTWNALATQDDDYAFDAISGSVVPGSDGMREVNLYPQGTGSPGNRGTVDIGGANNSTNDIARQIIHGISAEDLAALGQDLRLGSNGTLSLNGDTGISAGVKDELASIIGQKRIIPIFSSVSGNGNNADYTIVKWVGVRILDVKLTGKMSGKKLVVQPAPMLARYGTYATSGTEWSEYLVSPVILAQ